ncbi:MAG TPA: hypothetical protein PLF00_08260 [Candidatus Marinimicrobia bacterium]|nr:hypothetical protein [Candidatus Neomarinimicrobiota bacterium]
MIENKKKLRHQRNLWQVFELCGFFRKPCHVALSPIGSRHITADKREIKDFPKSRQGGTSFMLETLYVIGGG